MLSVMELLSKVEELKQLEALIREAEAEAERLKEEIKAEMTKQSKEEMIVDRYVIRWTNVVSNRFDSTAFKAVMPDVYRMYVKETKSRRFSITG